jgi:PAS domain S-box-containing protein
MPDRSTSTPGLEFKPIAGRADTESDALETVEFRSSRSRLPRLPLFVRPGARYGIAVIAVGAALVLRLTILASIGAQFAYLTFYPAVMAAAALCGAGPGLVATAASALAVWAFVLAPQGSLLATGIPGVASLVVFSGMGVLMSMLASVYHRARHSLEVAEKDIAFLNGVKRERDLFKNMLEGFAYCRMIYDLHGHAQDFVYLKVNDAFTRITGLRDVVGKKVSEVVPSIRESQPGLLETYARVARTGHPETLEVDFTPLGIWFSIAVYSPHRDHFVAVFEDITDRKRNLALIHTEKERLSVTLRSIGDAVIAADSEGRVTTLNAAAERLTGWKAEEALGRPCPEVFHIFDEDTRQPAENPMVRAIQSGTVVGLKNHTALVARDGTEVPIADSAAPIRDGAGKVLGAVMVFRDQALERRADLLMSVRLGLLEFAPTHSVEEVLRETLDRVGQLTRSPIGFYHFVDADQNAIALQTWSTRTLKEYCSALGTGLHYPVALAGVWADCIREGRAVIHNDYAALQHKKGLPEGHAALVRELVVPVLRDGRVLAILGVGNKTSDYTQDDVDIVSYIADVSWEITARKRAEVARDQMEEQLRRSQKLEGLGRLAGGIAHDFNNLLTVILSCAETLKEDHKAGAAIEIADIDAIHTASERARDLTRQLLAFARKQIATLIQLDLNAAVSGMQTLLGRVLGDDVELVVSLEPGLWPILCDPGQLEQVLLNLAVNSQDAMPDGGLLVIETRNVPIGPVGAIPGAHDPSGPWVCLVVRDTGTGMSPEVKARLFEPFFTTKEHGKGTGLGLAMVHGILSQAGAHIRADSEPGKGTTFEIRFRRGASDALNPSDHPPPVSTETRGTETILVVEDQQQVHLVMLRALRSAGYRVLVASKGDEALEVAQHESGKIQLLVSDIQMPGRSGRAVADELRALRPDLRTLFVSGHHEEDIDHGNPRISFLAKPFTPSSLLARVRAVLDAP